MKVVRPTYNKITGEYTATHKAYDFAGLNVPDPIKTGANGVIVERVDAYNTNWKTTGALTTKDYGNYIKIKHDDGSSELHAHLKQGSSLPLNTRVVAGQVVAKIGNTGNSTGPHLHSEYRNAQNINVEAEFIGGDSVTQAEIDQLRSDRDRNWNFYQQALKDIEVLKKQIADHKCPPTVDEKAKKLKEALKDFLS